MAGKRRRFGQLLIAATTVVASLVLSIACGCSGAAVTRVVLELRTIGLSAGSGSERSAQEPRTSSSAQSTMRASFGTVMPVHPTSSRQTGLTYRILHVMQSSGRARAQPIRTGSEDPPNVAGLFRPVAPFRHRGGRRRATEPCPRRSAEVRIGQFDVLRGRRRPRGTEVSARR